MPRIKRWGAISQDYWTDPEVIELEARHGLKAAIAWQQLILKSTPHSGDWPGTEDSVCTSLASQVRTTKAKVRQMLGYAREKGWLPPSQGLRLVKWAKYNRTGEPEKTPDGDHKGPPLPTNLPTNQEEKVDSVESTSSDVVTEKAKPAAKKIRDWEPDEMDIYNFLSGTALPMFQEFYSPKIYQKYIVRRTLEDPDWWAHLSEEIDGLDLKFLHQTLAGLSRWMKDNKHRRPTINFRGWLGNRIKANTEKRNTYQRKPWQTYDAPARPH